MAIEVTEMWSPDRISAAKPLRGTIVYTVIGTSDRATALTAASDATTGKHVLQRNEQHPYSPKLRCEGPEVASKKGPEHWEIACPCSVPANGEFDDEEDDPLHEKAKINWSEVNVSEPVDTDFDGRPMVYANGERIEGLSRDITYHRLQVVKNFLFWDPLLATTFNNATNATSVILTGGPTVAPHHMRVAGIIPAGSFTLGASFVPVSLTLDIVFDDSLGSYPFQHRVMNQGTRGFNSDSPKEPTSLLERGDDGSYTRVSHPFRIDKDGVPLALDGGSALKVKAPNGAASPYETPSSSPTPWTQATDDTATDGRVWKYQATDLATFGYFKKAKIINVNPLLVLFNG